MKKLEPNIIAEDKYLSIAERAFDIFNQQMDTDFNLENTPVKLINAENADVEIPKFLKAYKEVVEPQMLEPGYYQCIRAEAFVTPKKAGIIARTDTCEHELAWHHILLHEISHIYCMRHELKDGSSFFKKYCVGYAETSFQEGAIAAGHEIWREFEAEYLARLVDVYRQEDTLKNSKKFIVDLLKEMDDIPDDFKACVTGVLIELFSTVEVVKAKDKKSFFEIVGKIDGFQSVSWQEILSTAYDQLFNKKRDFWELDVDFIETLGNQYLMLKTEKTMKKLTGDTKGIEILKDFFGNGGL